MNKSWLTCGSRAQLMCSIQSICAPWSFHDMTCSTVHVLHALLHTFYRTCFQRSWSVHTFGCCFVNWRGGADEVDHFRLPGPPGLSTMPGWYRACQIGKSEQQVHLKPLCCIWSSGCSFGFCIPVSSLQYQLIGKLKGRGSHPHRWARGNWSDVCFVK